MKKKPIIHVAVTDGNGSIGAVFSGTGTPKATFTIREDDVLLERTYVLPKREEGQTDDELALVRDVFVLNRWKELVVNYFPGLVGMPGGPDLDVCEHCGQPVPVFVTPLDDEGNPNGATEAVEGVRSVSITEEGQTFADSIRDPGRVTVLPEPATLQMTMKDALDKAAEMEDDEGGMWIQVGGREGWHQIDGIDYRNRPLLGALVTVRFDNPEAEDTTDSLHTSTATGQRTGRTKELLKGARR